MKAIHRFWRKLKNEKETQIPIIDPREALYRSYSEIARKQGFKKLHLLLSFDCDTPEDIPAAEALFNRLSDLGIQSVFAVPGAQLI